MSKALVKAGATFVGPDHLLRLHAGRGTGGRPPPALLEAHGPALAQPLTAEHSSKASIRALPSPVPVPGRRRELCLDALPTPLTPDRRTASTATVEVQRRDVTHVLRLHGTVEAENAVAVVVPRILGQNVNALVVTRLVPNGTRVKTGDLLVEFDRQAQLDLALEKKAEFRDLEEQVHRKSRPSRPSCAPRTRPR